MVRGLGWWFLRRRIDRPGGMGEDREEGAAASWRLNVNDFQQMPERPKEPLFVTRVFLRSSHGGSALYPTPQLAPLLCQSSNIIIRLGRLMV